jgi:hypothetical protein
MSANGPGWQADASNSPGGGLVKTHGGVLAEKKKSSGYETANVLKALVFSKADDDGVSRHHIIDLLVHLLLHENLTTSHSLWL